jgi:hypothetical protein
VIEEVADDGGDVGGGGGGRDGWSAKSGGREEGDLILHNAPFYLQSTPLVWIGTNNRDPIIYI